MLCYGYNFPRQEVLGVVVQRPFFGYITDDPSYHHCMVQAQSPWMRVPHSDGDITVLIEAVEWRVIQRARPSG